MKLRRKCQHRMVLRRMVSNGVIKKARPLRISHVLEDELNGAYWSNSVANTKSCRVLIERLSKKESKIKSKYFYRSKVAGTTDDYFTCICPKDKHTGVQINEDDLPLIHLKTHLSQIKLNQPCSAASKCTNNGGKYISSPLHDSHLCDASLEAFPNFGNSIGDEICEKETNIGKELKKTLPHNHTQKTSKHTRKAEEQLPQEESLIIKGDNSIKREQYSCKKNHRRKQLYSRNTAVFSASPSNSKLRANGNIKPLDECDFTIVQCDEEVSFRIPTSSAKKIKPNNNSSIINCKKERIKIKKRGTSTSSVRKSKLNNNNSKIDCNKESIEIKKSGTSTSSVRKSKLNNNNSKIDCNKESIEIKKCGISTSSVRKSKLNNNNSKIYCNKESIKVKKIDIKSNEEEEVDHFVIQGIGSKGNYKPRVINETFNGSYIGSSTSHNGRMRHKKKMLYKQKGVFDSTPDRVRGEMTYMHDRTCNESTCNESIMTSVLLSGKP